MEFDHKFNYDGQDYQHMGKLFTTEPNKADAIVQQLLKERTIDMFPILKWIIHKRYMSQTLYDTLVSQAVQQKNHYYLGPMLRLLHVGELGLQLGQTTIDTMSKHYFFVERTSDVANMPAHIIQNILEHPRIAYRKVLLIVNSIRSPRTLATLLLFNEMQALNIPDAEGVFSPPPPSDQVGYSQQLPPKIFHQRLYQILLKDQVHKPEAMDEITHFIIRDSLKLNRPDLATIWLARRYHTYNLLPTRAILSMFLAHYNGNNKPAYTFWHNFYSNLFTISSDDDLANEMARYRDHSINQFLVERCGDQSQRQGRTGLPKILAEHRSSSQLATLIANNLMSNYFGQDSEYGQFPEHLYLDRLLSELCGRDGTQFDIVAFANAAPRITRILFAGPLILSRLAVNNVEAALKFMADQSDMQILYTNSYQLRNDLLIGLKNAQRFDILVEYLNCVKPITQSTVNELLSSVTQHFELAPFASRAIIKLVSALVPKGNPDSSWTHDMVNARLSIIPGDSRDQFKQILAAAGDNRTSVTDAIATLFYLEQFKTRPLDSNNERHTLDNLLKFIGSPIGIDCLNSPDGAVLQVLAQGGSVGKDIVIEYTEYLSFIYILETNKPVTLSAQALYHIALTLVDNKQESTLIQIFNKQVPENNYDGKLMDILIQANSVAQDTMTSETLAKASRRGESTSSLSQSNGVIKPVVTLSDSTMEYLRKFMSSPMTITD
ncbi:hypothetical protein SAMD00019534_010410 [Acytostelium subglobosum LB1]|uniref:hypothetical protein n=1 Tax=Acytostelium subglobosum LB1 TaxID=1410327 RepID=UPI0006450CA5|nr:hypothetical protein SAMD00019534_010410 [Acytostelium subglobosum LB1]GAM17866.1 hypothetical protein SAMD00019534_010410 [Acytostelium subglobosum LB1]|eukprot:XP_012758462.1 hypothetical protein SAMD00019534_010410 [Acytostelium subglobosum LB1]